MADSYQFCPCGSGEKIKHCCTRSLQNDVAKILDMLRNAQQAAAVQRVQQLVVKYPDDLPSCTAFFRASNRKNGVLLLQASIPRCARRETASARSHGFQPMVGTT